MKPSRPKPLHEHTFDELMADKKRRRDILKRGRYVHRIMGGLPANAPLARQTLEDAVLAILAYGRRRRDGEIGRPSAGGPAQRQRLYRLRKLTPSGVDAATWAEIVAHFKGVCATPSCGSPAVGVSRLPDGTPVIACTAHRTDRATALAPAAQPVQGSGS